MDFNIQQQKQEDFKTKLEKELNISKEDVSPLVLPPPPKNQLILGRSVGGRAYQAKKNS